ncbi:transcription factor bHLH7-like isoform X1 [Macadamia integrifolia]|uniref:transcription factor bHLH7-like isoform X1 n=1 Tax=Macadamia integrifolia TaxID=60698 RepID=UPI001C502217|nr:transcription factor bHLH7-like isoform X1 [Macadamia integrifolia]XP_042495083.1 transcription factor bHLH7-like isoform X1 [Macadamia integrifolia]XP_042495090.1 transcription factor bHLH7-like isoform X1 [Macadamia integrifolia]XP_042495095.1 transcription factor bHLH7-like isoform X1 [Macadamia integrifolia]
MQAINGVPKFQKDKLYEDSRSVTDSNPINSALNMDVSKTLSSAHMLNIDNHESLKAPARFLCSDKLKMLEGNNYNVPMAGYLYPDGEGEPQNKLISENKISVLNNVSSSQESDGDQRNVSQPHLAVTVAVPTPSMSVSKRKASIQRNNTGRQNRARISGGINTLRELLPHSEEGSKASVLDDTIDYIKYLQLQIKMLSQSRLGGEAAAAPFTHLEGYGHYLFHQEMLNEPLEEMIGKLMELDIATATQLLDSKGLSVIPIALAEGVFQKR